MTISMRCSDRDATLIRQYAELTGVSVSELIRQTVLARIEDEYDLQTYERAYAANQAQPETFTLDEVEKELGLA